MKHKNYRFVLYLIACCGIWFIQLLPRILVLRFAALLARIAFVLIKKERLRAIKHLTRAFGESKTPQECYRIGEQVFEHFAYTMVDFVKAARYSPDALKRLISFDDVHLLQDIIEKRKTGCIVLTGHLGNWELLGSGLIARGFRGLVIGRRIYYKPYNDIVVRLRKCAGVYTHFRDESFRRLIKRLRAGDIAGILPDQDIDSIDGIFVDFFGKPAYTPTGPAKLALGARVPIVIAFMKRLPDFRYRFSIADIIEPDLLEGEQRQQAIVRITNRWSQVLEREIMAAPEQWAWVHNRWKTQPERVENRS